MLNLVIKFPIFIYTFFLLGSPSAFAAACQIHQIDPYSFDIEWNDGRKIGIHGWLHPGADTQQTYGNIYLRMKHPSCKSLENNLDQILDDNSEVIDHGQRVYLNLKKQNQYQVLAAERSENEKDLVNQTYRKVISKAQSYKKACPSLASKINRSLLAFPGPEAIYSYGVLQKDLLAPESGRLLSRAAQASPAWASQNDHLYNYLSPRTRKLLDQDERFGFVLTDHYKQTVLNSEDDPKLKRYLQEYLDYNEFLFKQVPERNAYMIENLLEQNQSTALVVGFHHVEDFKKQLSRICRSQGRYNYSSEGNQGVR